MKKVFQTSLFRESLKDLHLHQNTIKMVGKKSQKHLNRLLITFQLLARFCLPVKPEIVYTKVHESFLCTLEYLWLVHMYMYAARR